MQENFGVNVCTMMSMMSQEMMPSACEVDIAGVVFMYALQLASGKPSGLVDWNNNYGKDPEKYVFFHCGNWAKDFLPDARIATAPILGTVFGEENTVGALAGALRRVLSPTRAFTDDPLNTFVTKVVVRIPRLQSLIQHICRAGFEHHVAMNGRIVRRALPKRSNRTLGMFTSIKERSLSPQHFVSKTSVRLARTVVSSAGRR